MQKVINGDCLALMRSMDNNSIDFVVCDPPYGLKFMGKSWDHGVPGRDYWAEALRDLRLPADTTKAEGSPVDG